MSLRPRKEHRAGEPRLCGAGQDVLQEMTQLVSGDVEVRIQPYKLGQGTEDDFAAPSAGRSGVDRRHQHRELPRGFFLGVGETRLLPFC